MVSELKAAVQNNNTVGKCQSWDLYPATRELTLPPLNYNTLSFLQGPAS